MLLIRCCIDWIRPNPYECPSENVIVQRYRCHDKASGTWKDCYQRSCCKGYTFIAGRCLQSDQDPCSLDLCEQKCSVFFGRVICTCFAGYKFHAENQKNGLRPYCIGKHSSWPAGQTRGHRNRTKPGPRARLEHMRPAGYVWVLEAGTHVARGP